MPGDEIVGTHETYELIAPDYARRWATNDAIAAEARNRFARQLKEGSVIDLGCGPGRDLRLLSRMGFDATGLDRSVAMLREAHSQWDGGLICGDLTSLPFANATFDGAWASASLLHLSKSLIDVALGEIRRVLRPNGVFHSSFKHGRGEGWRTRDNHRRYFSFYEGPELDDHLRGTGFTVEEVWLEEDSLGRDPWLCRICRS